MTLSLPSAHATSPGQGIAARLAGYDALAMAACLLAAAWQATTPINTDVSWLLDAGGRLLDGARWYVDVIEVNPPASILLYMPAVALGRLLHIAPEIVTRLLVGVAVLGSVYGTRRILARAGLLGHADAGRFTAMALTILLILPMNAFAQREHIAVVALLPALACLAVRSGAKAPSGAGIVLAGVAAAVAVCIKPMFALAFVGPVLFVILRSGLAAALKAVEIWIAAGLAAIYGAAVLVLVPAFAERVMPAVLAVYVPARLGASDLLASPGVLVWLIAVAAILWRRDRVRPDPFALVAMLASGGFEAVFLLQAKGWPYHALPAVALAVLGTARPCVAPSGPLLAPARLLSLLAALGGLWFFADRIDYDAVAPGLATAITDVAPHPRLMTISSDIALGHPLVREVGGRWVGTAASQWISGTAARLSDHPSADPRFARYIAAERATVAHDLVAGHPNVVLVDGPAWLGWIAADPALADAFAHYRQTGVYGGVMLWTRKDQSP